MQQGNKIHLAVKDKDSESDSECIIISKEHGSQYKQSQQKIDSMIVKYNLVGVGNYRKDKRYHEDLLTLEINDFMQCQRILEYEKM